VAKNRQAPITVSAARIRLFLRYAGNPETARASMKSPRWIAISQSAFNWEREALEFLRSHLPDHEPWRAWANFEFIDDEGAGERS
jgi:hypothetical protein